MDWYPRNPKDFDMGTLGWSLAARGAYSCLIDAYYENEGPLPDDDDALAALLRVSVEEWQNLAVKVRAKFTPLDGKLHHERCDEELEKQHNMAEKSRNNGKKGGRPKVKNTRKNKEINPDKTEVVSTQNPDKTQTKPHNTTRHNITNDQSIDHSDLVRKVKGFHISQENAEAMIDLWRRKLSDGEIVEHLAEAAAKGLDRDGLRDHMTGLTVTPPDEMRDKLDRMRAEDLNAGGSRTTADSLRSLQRLASKGLLTDETAQRLGLQVAEPRNPVPGDDITGDDPEADPLSIPEFLRRDGNRSAA